MIQVTSKQTQRWRLFIARRVALMSGTILMGVLTGCASLIEPTPSPLREASTAELLNLLEERHAELQTFKGLFQAKIQGAGIPLSQRVDGMVVYSRPAQFRFKGFSRVGGVLFDIRVDEEVYEAAIPAAGRFLTGRVDDLTALETLGEAVRLTLFAAQGVAGVNPVEEGRQVELVEDGYRYRLDVYESVADGPAFRRLARRIFFERHQLRVVREERLSVDDGARVVTSFEDYRPVPQGAKADGPPLLLPFSILVQNSEAEGRLAVTFREIQANAPLARRDLRLMGSG